MSRGGSGRREKGKGKREEGGFYLIPFVSQQDNGFFTMFRMTVAWQAAWEERSGATVN
jgi:hypothetical protein